MMLISRARQLASSALACLLSLTAMASQVHAQNAIEAVSASSQGSQVVVRIDFSQPLTSPPSGFTVQSPARVALDFVGVSSKVSQIGRAHV